MFFFLLSFISLAAYPAAKKYWFRTADRWSMTDNRPNIMINSNIIRTFNFFVKHLKCSIESQLMFNKWRINLNCKRSNLLLKQHFSGFSGFSDFSGISGLSGSILQILFQKKIVQTLWLFVHYSFSKLKTWHEKNIDVQLKYTHFSTMKTLLCHCCHFIWICQFSIWSIILHSHFSSSNC